MRQLILLTLAFGLAGATAAQSRRNYDGFYIELNRNNVGVVRAVAIRFSETNGGGCSKVYSANGTLINVTWDIVPTKFTVRFNSGRKSFFVPDSINKISNIDRGLLADIFAERKSVNITWRECGSGNIADLIGIRTLDSERSPFVTPRGRNPLPKVSPRGGSQVGLPLKLRSYLNKNYAGWQLVSVADGYASDFEGAFRTGDFDGDGKIDFLVKFIAGRRGYIAAFLERSYGYEAHVLHGNMSAAELRRTGINIFRKGEQLGRYARLPHDSPFDGLCESDTGGAHIYQGGRFIQP